MSSFKPQVIAHRGLHQTARENTLLSFELALQAGADAIELDVHSTADGEIVVHHDFEVGTTALRKAAYAEISAAAASLDFEIPRLAEVLAKFSGLLKVYVEVKAPGIELEVARVIRESQCELAVHSFDHRISQRMKDLVPGVSAGVLAVCRPVEPATVLRAASATDYWPHVDFVDEELVSDIHDAGGRVVVWTANSQSQWSRLRDIGVDAICTDKPGELREWLG